jgi:hypothetical protein
MIHRDTPHGVPPSYLRLIPLSIFNAHVNERKCFHLELMNLKYRLSKFLAVRSLSWIPLLSRFRRIIVKLHATPSKDALPYPSSPCVLSL